MDFNHYITLSHLHKILSSNAISVGILCLSFLFILNMNLTGLMVMVIALLAVPFSVYMLYVLYRYNKRSWIYGFFIGLGVSFLPVLIFSNENIFLIAAKYAPLLFFVLFNFSLKMQVGEWLIEKEFYDETFSG